MINRRARLLILCVVAIIIAGCSQSSSSGDASDSAVAEFVVEETTTTVEVLEAEVTSESSSTTESPTAPETDFGVTDSSIRIGYSLDLLGPYSSHDSVVAAVHEAYFAAVNEQGGIDGRDVELVILDNGFDAPLHLDNVSQLAAATDAGVAAIGNLSHPLFGEASVSVLGDSGIGAVTDLKPNEPPVGRTSVAAVAGSVCAETTFALEALAPAPGATRRLAIVTRDEPWATHSGDVARANAEALGFQVVLDVANMDSPAEVVTSLLEIESDVVWLAVSPLELAELSSVIEPAARNWRWAGSSIGADAALLEPVSAEALASVYVQAFGIEPIDLAPQREQNELAELVPELTYAEARAGLIALRQAELLHQALEEAVEDGDLTRAAIAAQIAELGPEVNVALYRPSSGSATFSRPIADGDGSTGFTLAEDLVPTLVEPGDETAGAEPAGETVDVESAATDATSPDAVVEEEEELAVDAENLASCP